MIYSPRWWEWTVISDPCNFDGKKVCKKCDVAGNAILDVWARLMDDDGYHEFKPEDQAKVRQALENSYVPDEDWKGVRHTVSG
jgi:hypothetical protein